MQNKTRHAPATAMNKIHGMRDSEVIMRVSNAWNREIESEKERGRERKKERKRERERERERRRMQKRETLKEPNGEHARSAIEFVFEHDTSCCNAFTNNIRLRSFMYINACVLSIYATYASTKWTRQNVWWEMVRGGGGACLGESIRGYRVMMNWIVGWILRCGWMVGRSS